MDEELTEEYNEPCGQCGAVSWALSDGMQFFCKNCHNVIERTQEAVDVSTYLLNTRISSLSGSHKKSAQGGGRYWMVCEGFQFVLKSQAEALVGLGVCPQLKTKILWAFWKRYLQNTRQAYTRAPISSVTNPVDMTSESETESAFFRDASDQRGAGSASAGYSSDGKSSVGSGSLDAKLYLMPKERECHNLMSMPRTLALCLLALLWLREAVTLSDLLRLVSKRLVPYINVHEDFPEEIKFFGRDALIFRVETIPSYNKVCKEALQLAKVLQLPTFPLVTQDCLLHPALLSCRYLMDANLPDELHPLVYRVIEKTAMGEEAFLTFNPTAPKSSLQCYDLQAAALIIVTMKLLFRLNDQGEWKLSRRANEEKANKPFKKKNSRQGRKMFSLRSWYMIVHPPLQLARKKEELFVARQQWKSKKPIIPFFKNRYVVLKRRRVTKELQNSFRSLAGSAPEKQASSPSSFLFRWGEMKGADGPSLHHQHLKCFLEKRGKGRLFSNQKYWYTDLKFCPTRANGKHFLELEPSLPRMYVWLLGLFSFLLGVSKFLVHKAVITVEQRLLLEKTMAEDTNAPRRKRRKTSFI